VHGQTRRSWLVHTRSMFWVKEKDKGGVSMTNTSVCIHSLSAEHEAECEQTTISKSCPNNERGRAQPMAPSAYSTTINEPVPSTRKKHLYASHVAASSKRSPLEEQRLPLPFVTQSSYANAELASTMQIYTLGQWEIDSITGPSIKTERGKRSTLFRRVAKEDTSCSKDRHVDWSYQ
jgi:hypothetical protein